MNFNFCLKACFAVYYTKLGPIMWTAKINYAQILKFEFDRKQIWFPGPFLIRSSQNRWFLLNSNLNLIVFKPLKSWDLGVSENKKKLKKSLKSSFSERMFQGHLMSLKVKNPGNSSNFDLYWSVWIIYHTKLLTSAFRKFSKIKSWHQLFENLVPESN